MGRLLTVLAAVLAVLLFLGLALPPLLDWSSLKPKIAADASKRLGVSIAVDGAVRVRLLPTPVVHVARMRADLPEGGWLISEGLSASLSWGELLSGSGEAHSITLERPVLTLGAGRVPWQALREIIAAGERADAFYVNGGSVVAADGVTIARDIDLDWTGGDKELSLSVMAIVGEAPADLSLTMPRPGAHLESKAAMRVRLRAPAHGLMLRFGGVTTQADLSDLAGDITLAADDLKGAAGFLAALLGGQDLGLDALEPLHARSLRGGAKLSAEADGFALSDLGLDLGTYHFGGSGTISASSGEPRLSLALNANTLTMDQVLAKHSQGLPSARALHDALALRDVPALWRPVNLDIRLGVKNLLLAQSVVKDLRLGFVARGGRAYISELGGQFPGGVLIDLEAGIARAAETRTKESDEWTARVTLRAPRPIPVLRQIGLTLPQGAKGIIAGLNGTAWLGVNRTGFAISDIRINAGEASAVGDADLTLGKVMKLDVGARLNGFGVSAAQTIAHGISVTPSLSQSPIYWVEGWPEDLAARFRIEAQETAIGGRGFSGLFAEGSVDGQGLDLGQFAAKDVDGSIITLKGWAPFARSAVGEARPGTIEVSAQVPQFGQFIKTFTDSPLPRAMGQDAGLVSLKVQFGPERLTGALSGEVGAAVLDGDGVIDYGLPNSWPRETRARLEMRSEDGRDLARLWGLGSYALQTEGSEPGLVRAALSLSRGKGSAAFALKVPGVDGAVGLSLTNDGQALFYEGRADLSLDRLETGSNDLNTAFSHPGSGRFGSDVTFKARVKGTGDELELSAIDARAGASAATGTLKVTWAQNGGRPAITGDVKVTDILFPKLTWGGPGAQIWPETPLPVDLTNARDMAVSVAINSLTLGELAATDLRFLLTGDADGLYVQDFTGTVSGGDLAGVMRARNLRGALAVDLDLFLHGAKPFPPAPDLDDGLADLVKLTGDAHAQLSTKGVSVRELVSGLTGTIRTDLRKATIAPFDLEPLNRAWPGLDSLSAFDASLAAAGDQGTTEIQNLSGTIAIERGIVSFDGLSGETQAGPVALSGLVNLPAFAMDLEALFPVTEEERVLRLRVAGPLNALERSLDANDLRRALAIRLRDSKAGRISDDDLPQELRELLEEMGLDKSGASTTAAAGPG